MAQPHPKLSCYPRGPAGLGRPTIEHPVLGALEYINRDGGWWQGIATIAGWVARMDVQLGANPTPADLSRADESKRWLQENDATVRSFIARQLEAGDYDLYLGGRTVPATPLVDAMRSVAELRPTMLVLSREYARLEYDCYDLPGGNLLGAREISVIVDKGGTSCRDVHLTAWTLDTTVRHLLERRLPNDAKDFEHSIADQFLAKFAQASKIKFDAELIELLNEAIKDVDRRMRMGSPECVSYMTTAKIVLSELAVMAKLPRPVISHVRAEVCMKHPAGKRKPIKDRLVFVADEEAHFDGSGAFPRITLFTLSDLSFEKAKDPDEAFRTLFQERLQIATQWLARQSPIVFEEMRAAGFDTEMNFFLLVRVASDHMHLRWPAEFAAQCVRHGLALSVTMLNTE